MKAVLISIQPKWVFLIIAKKMGWDIGKEKTIEVRKSFPKADGWNKKVKIYCSKNKKSFAKIPKVYQPLMEKFLGKVIGEFVCDSFYGITNFLPYDGEDCHHSVTQGVLEQTCLEDYEIDEYLGKKDGYGWHISQLKIYDKPKELSEFKQECKQAKGFPKTCKNKGCDDYYEEWQNCYAECACNGKKSLTRPPQSWCYVENANADDNI